MDAETKQTITIMAREIAQEMCRNPGTATLPARPMMKGTWAAVFPRNVAVTTPSC